VIGYDEYGVVRLCEETPWKATTKKLEKETGW